MTNPQAKKLANIYYRVGRPGYIVSHMTNTDDLLQAAIIEQLNAELGAKNLSMKDLAKAMGRPYDSTRNYLRGERAMPLGVFIEIAAVLGLAPDEMIKRARQRL